MKIAFYAPLKSPTHTVPSGDRLMARQIIAALKMTGHQVEVASELRSFTPTPEAGPRMEIARQAKSEGERLLEQWRDTAAPDLWFTYHPYYKTPDLIGPFVARRLNIPYVTAEASYSRRHDETGWHENQRLIADAVRLAAVNLCFTERDRMGLLDAIPEGCYERFPPFIDAVPFARSFADPRRLITVAMLRRGDKFDSYAMLASALDLIRDQDWTLTVIGDGPMRAEVRSLFSAFSEDRIIWRGERSTAEIAKELATAGLYVWPGCNEAYGLAYLEAQATGLPVVAQATAGVPEVVMAGMTGLLTQEGDIEAYAGAIAELLIDASRHRAMANAAYDFVHQERSLTAASTRLETILRKYLGDTYYER
ncbi:MULTISPECIES: glycosyltransferase family 4 protein [Rhizobium]|uniref:Glycosyltransferase family 4 protein n=1 Tax=Rhizobium tropici TaxID=398 RepID=A0A6P1C5G9_RHITR|nr:MULTISPECIES: glycosyltransferase family 4 protein [Rhizobium]AGB75249.1 putative glycosyltransferase [Rhizobium tropici CIAT 899]MBB4243907.1 glycosyltransferase involved in cell wall biosynthesis [Rhizobium tropici]MBB5595021.1 glycosyltransferase involved in cell wall biosynthesis [Rhizobium tropici]MBB6494247.1 glycosyltransferase involved in cell wall biosynthesis [Rhizobium tropici]NEV12410.1 glycosyltransferase family 4 protein [Rhizobium tropici]